MLMITVAPPPAFPPFLAWLVRPQHPQQQLGSLQIAIKDVMIASPAHVKPGPVAIPVPGESEIAALATPKIAANTTVPENPTQKIMLAHKKARVAGTPVVA